ncbi:3-deoxy-7-phosphoheptulonate synthase [Streptomyces triticagri]|uniref:Phospho-2-dehydro-3-deoxyheptonate aldolase n=1 Tax=Streptomyces triticagri TaxID=2293568 RepID=A0A372M8Z9_9ACTN|nr:3-deoxy-7-phosphoheptulonate synthase class II [Streptomyces triticagri]RFU86777.1 3-deoxy-7-phosphoheptulonate synthase [Streptomyces triticagri]
MTTTAVRTLPAAQQPIWPDRDALEETVSRLRALPALVAPAECDRLRGLLAAAALGEGLLLQGGHCAETFGERSLQQVDGVVTTLRQMSEVLTRATGLPVAGVGRMAGQYAKPRSKPVETQDGLELPAYRGDIVNGLAFTPEDRTPDPRRMETAYRMSEATLQRITALGATSVSGLGAGDGSEFHVSHEALLLDYERALVRIDPVTGRRYAGSGHLLWIGERTRQLDGAHVDFAASIANPVAVKVGPTATADELLALTDLLDPDGEPGRLTFITRMGADRIEDVLPPLVQKVTASGHPVLWVCDPMHGNTRVTDSGVKSRRVADIAAETRSFVAVHRDVGSHPGGLHLEMTGGHVTECTGGTDRVSTEDLHRAYESACDPRLNRSQSIDLAFLAAERWGEGR